MALNKKHIKSHFREDSDPIEDMSIGMDNIINHWVETETEYSFYNEKDLLLICAKYGKADFVKYLLAKGYNVHYEDDKALYLASTYNYPEVVKLLLDAGANVHAEDDRALCWASYHGYIEVVKLLLEAGAYARANHDWPLRYAFKHKHHEVYKLLSKYIAKQNKIVKESITHFVKDSDPIDDMNIGMDSVIKDWVENETEHDYVEKDLLWICAKYNKTNFIKYLIDKGVDIHLNNNLALRAASIFGHIKVMKLLLDAGADIHVDNDLVLRIASEYGKTNVVKLLLNIGANVHALDDYALRQASANNHIETVKVLLDAGANVNIHDDVALRSASKKGHTKMVKVLLDAGANVHAYDDQSLYQANKNGHTEVVKLLQDHITKEKKVVKESITHFVEDSDPVHDMHIGIRGLYNDWLNDIFEWAPHIKDALEALKIDENPPYLKRRVKEVELIIKYGDDNAEKFLEYILKKYDIPITFNNNYFLRIAADYDEFKLAKKMIAMGANLDNALGYAKVFHRSKKATDNLELIKRDIDEENS